MRTNDPTDRPSSCDTLDQLAAILARGLLRLRETRGCERSAEPPDGHCEIPLADGPKGLEFCEKARLSVQRG
jgi:hypothetical protein